MYSTTATRLYIYWAVRYEERGGKLSTKKRSQTKTQAAQSYLPQ